MWRIKHIDCEDFISFKSVSVDIPENVCTLIYGVNLDNDRQKNNGTGKSSLVEAIAFGLTGEPLRGVDKAEEIINDRSDTAHVRLTLSNDYDNTQFTIDRTLHRKQSQAIECHKFDADGVEIEKDKTSQATVMDYNRYILDEIGLTKDDIYSNFILSSNRYKSFFDVSDKTKKTMINRFSGADIVDKAIGTLQADKVPAEKELTKAKEAKIAVDSKIEVIEQQIADAENKKEEYVNEKEERIKELKEKISEVREEIRNNKSKISETNKRLDDIDEVGADIEDMQSKGYDLSTAYRKVNDKLEEHGLAKTKDYLEMSKESDKKIHDISDEKVKKEQYIIMLGDNLRGAQKKADDAKEKVDKYAVECKKADGDAAQELTDIQSDIEKNEKSINEQWNKLRNLQDTSERLDKLVREAHNLLHGVITCPKCKHEFFLDENVSVEDAKKNLKAIQDKFDFNEGNIQKADKEYKKLKAEKDSLKQKKEIVSKGISNRSDQLRELRDNLNRAQLSLGSVTTEINEAQQKANALENDIKTEQAKIDNMLRNMLQEALGIIDSAIDVGERDVKAIKEKNVAAEASISAYEKSIETIENSSQDNFTESLNKSLAEYKTMQQEVILTLSESQKEFDKYVLQENYFAEFRSYLANKKVEAIAGVTNYFLELIGSDLRVEMLGFKRLKNGTIKDKISVNLLRNGVLAGSYARHSAGERSRVNLASILGLQRLTNNSADKGKGLDLLIADEILDSEDTTGIEATCEALNKLKVTALLVTQNPITSNDGETIRVTKENGYSTLEIE